jgi:hypothetical protein
MPGVLHLVRVRKVERENDELHHQHSLGSEDRLPLLILLAFFSRMILPLVIFGIRKILFMLNSGHRIGQSATQRLVDPTKYVEFSPQNVF